MVTTRNQQVARIDYEADGEIAAAVEATVVRRIGELAASVQAIVDLRLPQGRRDAGRRRRRRGRRRAPRAFPSWSIPKVPHIERYAGATIVTPNHHEAEAVTHMRIRTAADAREAARRFRERARSEAVLITRGEHGMWLLGPA